MSYAIKSRLFGTLQKASAWYNKGMFNKTPSGSVVEPASRSTGAVFAPATPGQQISPTGAPVTSQNMVVPKSQGEQRRTIIMVIIMVLLAIISIVFLILFIMKLIESQNLIADQDSRIDAAVAVAVAENTEKLNAEFEIARKDPYREFLGPEDYGSLAFKYPQTWSVYIAKNAANGGDFEVYMNPVEVEAPNSNTINALRVTIRDTAIDSVVQTYESLVKSGKLTFSTRQVGGVTANLYVGQLPSGNLQGAVCLFKLRDKTVVLQTDANVFLEEFYRLLDTVTMSL